LKITPLDIKKQEFNKVIRGFDPIEVEAFLEMVAEEFEILIREKNHLSDEVLKLKTQLQDYQVVEKTFKESLMSAQKTINQSRENSQREANLIIKEAEVRADKILEDTKIKLIEMKNELMIIKSQKDSFARRLRHLLESQLELIGVLEIDDLGLGQFERKKMIPNIDKKLAIKPAINNPSVSIQKKEVLSHDKDKFVEKKNINNINERKEQQKIKLSDQFII
jgi:cell division initiation protein